MLTPERLLRLGIEIIFVLLGRLVVWLGNRGNIFFARPKLAGLGLGVALILWGIRGISRKPGSKPQQPEDYTRAVSLTVLGIVLLAISRGPFAWGGPLRGCA